MYFNRKCVNAYKELRIYLYALLLSDDKQIRLFQFFWFIFIGFSYSVLGLSLFVDFIEVRVLCLF